jgi:hypothetical protein
VTGFTGLHQAQETPHRQRDGGGQNGIGDLDAGKEPEADAGGQDQPGVEARRLVERPAGEAGRQPAQQHHAQRQRDARGPVMYAEDGVANCHRPVDERRLLQIRDAVQPRRHPVTRIQHVAGNLRLYGVDVVHQTRGTDNAAEVDGNGK